MKSWCLLVSLSLSLSLSLALAPGVGARGVTAASSSPPTLVGISAAHHPTFDRVVFRFRGGLPSSHSTGYVARLLGDGSGLPVRIAGRAVLQVVMKGTQAHDASGSTAAARTAYALPNVMTTVQAGDFEGVVTYGIGVARRTPVHVFTLTRPDRLVVDVGAAFPTVPRRVWFVDQRHVATNTRPFFVSRPRPVIPTTPATGLMDRLFAGVLPGEHAAGLRLLRSGATGFRIRSIAGGTARVQLTGGCASGGSTVTVAGEIMATLRSLATVDWVKIYGPGGHTEHPSGHTDSIPTCLEP